MNVIFAIIGALTVAYTVGYVTSWVIHGKLFKRISNTRHYMKKGHPFKRAWNYAGMTL
ncbi:MAG: hypothetical protein Q8M99_11725 [Methylotenera sp.]|nr:hypothetical protein [Methylotenera sp.]